VKSLIEIFAPGMFSSVDDNVRLNLLSYMKMQHIHLPDKIIYSSDNKSVNDITHDTDIDDQLNRLLQEYVASRAI